MATISEILKVEKETRIGESANVSKLLLFKEGSFTRAYEFSAWLLVNFVCEKKGITPPKVTRKMMKDGVDFVFVGFPNVSTAKFIPSDLTIESVDDKQSVVDLGDIVPDDVEGIEKMLTDFQSWKESIPVKEEKPKGGSGASDRGEGHVVSLTMALQQIIGYDLSSHSPMEWGEFIKSLKADLAKII